MSLNAPDLKSLRILLNRFLSAITGGAVVGVLLAILLIMFIIYRIRKKDEGSYSVDENSHHPPHYSYAYQKAATQEFYAWKLSWTIQEFLLRQLISRERVGCTHLREPNVWKSLKVVKDCAFFKSFFVIIFCRFSRIDLLNLRECCVNGFTAI